MGGSSSGGFGGVSGRDEVRASQEQMRNAEYEAACNDYLRGLLVGFNDRDVAAVRTHLHEIEAALGQEVDGSIDLVFGGSVAKRTYVEGLSDVDSLVVLDNCELADATPDEAKFYLVNRLQERFPRTEIEEGGLAVTVHFSDIDVQLLPAVTCDGVTHIADSGTTWAPIRPKEFAAVLSRVNSENGGRVVPVVKLAKAIIAQLPEPQRISGYHAESLAVEAFRDYGGGYSLKEMAAHYFSQAADRVLRPIVDRTGQSVHVDDSLGAAETLERRVRADAFARVARRMRNADTANSIDGWRDLFDDR